MSENSSENSTPSSETPIGDSVPGQPAQQPDPVTPEQVGAGAAERPAEQVAPAPEQPASAPADGQADADVPAPDPGEADTTDAGDGAEDGPTDDEVTEGGDGEVTEPVPHEYVEGYGVTGKFVQDEPSDA